MVSLTPVPARRRPRASMSVSSQLQSECLRPRAEQDEAQTGELSAAQPETTRARSLTMALPVPGEKSWMLTTHPTPATKTPRLRRMSVRIPSRARSVVSSSPVLASSEFASPECSAVEAMLMLTSGEIQLETSQDSDIQSQLSMQSGDEVKIEDRRTHPASPYHHPEDQKMVKSQRARPTPQRSDVSSTSVSLLTLPPGRIPDAAPNTLIAARFELIQTLCLRSSSTDRSVLRSRRWKVSSTRKALKRRMRANGELIKDVDRVKREFPDLNVGDKQDNQSSSARTHDVKARGHRGKPPGRRFRTSVSMPLGKIRDIWRSNYESLRRNSDISVDDLPETKGTTNPPNLGLVGISTQAGRKSNIKDDGWGLLVEEEDSAHPMNKDLPVTASSEDQSQVFIHDSEGGEKNEVRKEDKRQQKPVLRPTLSNAFDVFDDPGERPSYRYSGGIFVPSRSVRQSMSTYWKHKAAKQRHDAADADHESRNAVITSEEDERDGLLKDYHTVLRDMAGK